MSPRIHYLGDEPVLALWEAIFRHQGRLIARDLEAHAHLLAVERGADTEILGWPRIPFWARLALAQGLYSQANGRLGVVGELVLPWREKGQLIPLRSGCWSVGLGPDAGRDQE
ncbi:MAG: hypothetical protein H0U55_16065 [Rubrobacteraceae bacterium]|nr:hypothetical protein [Rubrobacteraceae bacterium]